MHEMDQLMTTIEAAELLRVNRDTIQRYVKNGQLKAIRLNGKFLRIIPASVEAFMTASEVVPSIVNSKE